MSESRSNHPDLRDYKNGRSFNSMQNKKKQSSSKLQPTQKSVLSDKEGGYREKIVKLDSSEKGSHFSWKYVSNPLDKTPDNLCCIKCQQNLDNKLFSKPQIKLWRKQQKTMADKGLDFSQLPNLMKDGPYCLNCALKQRTHITCKRCSKPKPLSEYSGNQRKQKYQALCLVCMKDYQNPDSDDQYSFSDRDECTSESDYGIKTVEKRSEIEGDKKLLVETSSYVCSLFMSLEKVIDQSSEPGTVETGFTNESAMTDEQKRALDRSKFFSDDEVEKVSEDEFYEEVEEDLSDNPPHIHSSSSRNNRIYKRSTCEPNSTRSSYHEANNYSNPPNFYHVPRPQYQHGRSRDSNRNLSNNRFERSPPNSFRSSNTLRCNRPSNFSNRNYSESNQYNRRDPNFNDDRPRISLVERLGPPPARENYSRPPKTNRPYNSNRYADPIQTDSPDIYTNSSSANNSTNYTDVRSEATASPQRTVSEFGSEFSFTTGAKRRKQNND